MILPPRKTELTKLTASTRLLFKLTRLLRSLDPRPMLSRRKIEHLMPSNRIVRQVNSESLRSRKTLAATVDTSIRQLFSETVGQSVAHEQLAQSARQRRGRPLTVRRAIAWSGWGITMAVFVTALFLNVPFALGNYLLSRLPGTPRTATFYFETSQQNLQPGESFDVLVKVDSADALAGVAAAVHYDPVALRLTGIEYSDSAFATTKISSADDVTGQLTLVREAPTKATGAATIGTLHFTALTAIGATTLSFEPGEFNNYVYRDAAVPAYPELRRSLTVVVANEQLPVRVVEAPKKTDVVVVDGDLSDWRDLLPYSPTITTVSGYQAPQQNVISGTLSNENDGGFSFNPSYRDHDLYLALFVRDDQLTAQDALQIKVGQAQAQFGVLAGQEQLLESNGLALRSSPTAFGYIAEVRIPVESFATSALNITQVDADAEGVVAQIILSTPEDSILNFR